MAKKKNNTMLLVLLAAGGAAAYYFYSRQSAVPAPAGGSVAPGATPGTTPVVYSSASTPSANANSATVVQGWFATLDPANKQQAYYQFANMTADEVNELADIIVNVWGSGAKPSAAQTTFWNAWRVKYHILDGTYA